MSTTKRPASKTTESPQPGFSAAAREFYAALAADNSREFWQAHRDEYEREVRIPLEALLQELDEEFGTAKVYRPNRDVRFSNDKSPYKTHQGASVSVATACGWYVEISANGLRVGGGFYTAESKALAVVRERIADDAGALFAAEVARLEANGWERGGDRLKTQPRGIGPEHPRLDLLRHRSIVFSKNVPHKVAASPEVVDTVRAHWADLRPAIEWLGAAIRDAEQGAQR